jgi:hypothetical protein
MKTLKIGAILIALLLAGMAIVSCASAECVCHHEDMQSQEEFKIVQSNTGTNLLDEFGLSRPVNLDNTVHLKTYTESKGVADMILTAINLSDRYDSIIGMYDFGNYQVLLISQGESILEAVSDGQTVESYSIVPQLLGEKKESGTPRRITTGNGFDGDYTLSTETVTQLYSLTLGLPDDDFFSSENFGILTTYIVKKSRTDEYRNGLGQTITSLTTSGWFYVDYGSSITSITDYSSWWINPLFPGWSQCYYNTQKSGVGTTSAQLYTHYKFGSFFFRGTMDMWVSCDAWLNADDGGSTNQWTSLYGDGCTG